MNFIEPSFPDFPTRILHGGDYNPEQWPEDIWQEDVRLMREANVNVATLPVFGWVTLQPDEETFTFDWLDRVLDLLHENGVAACLATATASVPAWLSQKYPDTLVTDYHDQKQKHGNRHTFCPNSENFKRLSGNLARQIAERYKNHPALLIWHVSNEYGTHCYCEQCEAAFRDWLKERYGSLEEVNRRWYNAFWGHTFTDWSQIEAPSGNGEGSNQALRIDYDRFQSASILGCYKNEAKILREITPHIPVTTNMMGSFKSLDYREWAKEMDIISWDCYPGKNAAPASIAFAHSLMRGLKDGQPWLLMEQTPSQQNWQAQNALKRPGVMRLWSYQALAHGADAIMYFQWRRSRGATEKYHGAVVEHVGTSKPRVFQEVAQLGRELENLGDKTIGSQVQSEAAVIFDWSNWWAVEYSSGPSVDLKYVSQCSKHFAALHNSHIATDIIGIEADFLRYKLIVAPVLYMCQPETARKLEEFVRNGGTLVTTFFSGIVDETDLVHLGGYPGPLRELLGIWAEEIDALMPRQFNGAVWEGEFAGLEATDCGLLCDIIHTEGAQVLAHYRDDFYANSPVVTRNDFGNGHAYYLASDLAADGLKGFYQNVCNNAGIEPVLADLPPGVEATKRAHRDGREIVCVLNHTTEAVEITLGQTFTDLISGEIVEGTASLSAYGVWLLQK